MIGFTALLCLVVLALGINGWEMALSRLLLPLDGDRILLMPLLFLLFLFSTGLWVGLNQMKRQKEMGALLWIRIRNRTMLILRRLQSPIFIVSALHVLIFIPLFLLSSSSWQESVWISLSILLTWMLWYNAGNCLIWSGMSIRNAAFLLMVLYGVVQYAVLHNPALSFLVFNSSRLGKSPFPHMLIQFSLLVAVLLLLRGILQRYEEWGVDKYD